MAYDVEQVRRQYPSLSDGRVWLDNAAGTQVPESVVEAMAEAHRAGLSNLGGSYHSSRRSASIVADARGAIADLVGVPDPSGVVFGESMTALTYRFAAALAQGWRPGDEVVVTQLDHDANVRPWVQAAQRAGATVRMAALDTETGDLPAEAVTQLINDRTRVVAVTAASNLIGATTDVTTITSCAAEAGALSYVDGVQHCPHASVRLDELGADFYATSAYKWSGPHLAAVVAADPWSLENVHPDKLIPSPDTVPERFEYGTRPFAALAGVVAAVEHLASLDSAATGSRAERLVQSRGSLVRHEEVLTRALFDGLSELENVRRYGSPRSACTPTAYFGISGMPPRVLAEKLDGHGVHVTHGHSYAWETMHALGVAPEGGVRASLCHYSDMNDVRRLVDALRDIAATA